jgi:hypothetical protein
MAISEMLLRLYLETTVPLLIADRKMECNELTKWDIRQAQEMLQTIAAHGDDILYRGKNTAKAVTALARALALMAFAPGGVTFLDMHFEAGGGK